MGLSADVMTSAQAARALGVSRRQVRRLAQLGTLIEVERVGGALLLDTRSVHRLADRGSQRGRPWSEHVAWAAIDLLDGGPGELVSAVQRSRLRARLRSIRADELVRVTRRRATVTRYRATQTALAQIRDKVALTGHSVIDDDRSMADAFGLAASASDTVDGYIAARLLGDFVDQHFLIEDVVGAPVADAGGRT